MQNVAMLQNVGIQNICIQNVSHISTNFCIHFVYKIQLVAIVLLILYTKCIATYKKMW